MQLFINYVDNTGWTADRFAPFGEVTEGMDDLDKIYSGYGEQSGRKATSRTRAKRYLDKNFPRLDRILTA